MKKLFMVGALVFSLVSFSGSALAASGYADAGCRLGSIVLGNAPGAAQVLSATLNATAVHTFGHTTGTFNCNPAGLTPRRASCREIS